MRMGPHMAMGSDPTAIKGPPSRKGLVRRVPAASPGPTG